MMKHLFKIYLLEIAKRFPPAVTTRLASIPLHPLNLMERWNIRRAITSGPPYRPTHEKIIIDITSACNLHCIDCNRSCGQGQAISDQHMGMGQVRKFVNESLSQGRKWKEIVLEGGEPSLHPRLADIVDLLLWYRKASSFPTNIRILTNGHNPENTHALYGFIQMGVEVGNSRKASKHQKHHCAFNVAPLDLAKFKDADFSQGCYLPACYGLGLTRHGYYPHPVCGGIDRVFGFDIGRKALPSPDDRLEDHFAQFCGICGFFLRANVKKLKRKTAEKEAPHGRRRTKTWERAYADYRRKKPVLSEYC